MFFVWFAVYFPHIPKLEVRAIITQNLRIISQKIVNVLLTIDSRRNTQDIPANRKNVRGVCGVRGL